MEQLSQSLASLHKERGDSRVSSGWTENLRTVHVSDGTRMRPEVEAALQQYLVDPMLEIKGRPSHRFRSDLVDVGYALASGGKTPGPLERPNLDVCAESIEYLHLGSLIVDDIQDGSLVRRSGQALHCMLGAPHALGVGNWLYFYAFRLIGELEIPAEAHRRLYKIYAKTVELAHYGQIMDLCLKIDQVPFDEVEGLCQDCSRYKTGSIVMLSMVMGAIVGGADAERIEAVEEFGYELGTYLQFLNDLGNFCGTFDAEKKWEDLLAWKPSLIWAFVLNRYGAEAFRGLQQAVQNLPEADALMRWMEKHDLLYEAKTWAEARFEHASQQFCLASGMSASDLVPLLKLKERIKNAYV